MGLVRPLGHMLRNFLSHLPTEPKSIKLVKDHIALLKQLVIKLKSKQVDSPGARVQINIAFSHSLAASWYPDVDVHLLQSFHALVL